MGHDRAGLGSAPIAQALQEKAAASGAVTRIPSEADMFHTTIGGHHGTHHTVGAAFWILAGTLVVIVFADALALLAVAFAIVTTFWWMYRELEHRIEGNDAELAPVTHLRPALTRQSDAKATSAHASWRGPSAA
jgi:hypothetical protein